jgi:hypothetical protein
MLFKEYPNLTLNLSITAGNNQGMKHSKDFSINRSGALNPMFGIAKSPEFIHMQTRDKRGVNNPQYGVIKTTDTIDKLTKYISVYDATTNTLLGTYSTVACIKHYKMGYDTLRKYVNTGKSFKDRIFTRSRVGSTKK